MTNKWDERYQTEEFIFGTQPHDFIARILPLLPQGGKALDLATGEGRNGIFLAEHGFEAEGVDTSAIGLEKAARMAALKGVNYLTKLADIAEMPFPANQYNVISSVFAHFAEPQRSEVMLKIENALKVGGMFAGVFFHPDNAEIGTAGLRQPDMLANEEKLKQTMPEMRWLISEHHLIEKGENDKRAVVYLLGERM